MSSRSAWTIWFDTLSQEEEEKLGVVAHTFNSSTWEAEAGGFLSSFEASLEWVPGQPGLHRETLSQKKQNKTNGKKIERESISLLYFDKIYILLS